MPAFIVIGLGYGDEGKGAVTDHLARTHNASGVVLSNGGAQRAHHVVLPDGRFHRFSQFGSGFFSGTPTYLDRNFLVNPHEIFNEGHLLAESGYYPWGKLRGVPALSVHADALVTTPFHIAANRLRQDARLHGTCGMGIGDTVSFAKQYPDAAIRVRDLHDRSTLREKLTAMQNKLREIRFGDVIDWNNEYAQMLVNPAAITDAMEVYRIFTKMIPVFKEMTFYSDDTIIFESGQGVLLDEFCGFHPHTTWSCTTGQNAIETALESFDINEIRKIGVMRSYMTRHGSGPFVTEDPELHERFPDAHNGSEGWQGSWRVGWTDLRALRYALECINGVDELSVTHMDRVKDDWRVCLDYKLPRGRSANLHVPVSVNRSDWEHQRALILQEMFDAIPAYVDFEGVQPEDLLEIIESYLEVCVARVSYGPTHQDFRIMEHA